MELLSLLEAGLNLVEALQTLAEKEGGGEREEVLSAILAAIHRGEPFSQAVASLPRHFSPLYVATIKAAERTGNVRRGARALHRLPGRARPRAQEDRLGEHLSGDPHGRRRPGARLPHVLRRAALRARVRGHGGHAAAFSKLLLAFGSFVGNNALVLGALFIGLAALRSGLVASRSPRVAQHPDLARAGARQAHEGLPARAPLPHHGMLLRAGIPAVRALDMVRDLLAAHLRPQLLASKKHRLNRPSHVGGARRGGPRHAGGGAHDGRGRAQRRHGPDARADRALP